MSLSHSPADVLRYLLCSLGLGVNPNVGTGTEDDDWQMTIVSMPDNPDNRITIYDTTGIADNRNQVDGTIDEHKGVMIRIRSATRQEGFDKAEEIVVVLDNIIYRSTVTIGVHQFLVQSVSRRGTINELGLEPGSGRFLFTINAIIALQQTVY